jgi:hypothetical protein
MIGIFACGKQLHCRVCNCRAVIDGVESDHSAVQLDLALTLLKHKLSTALDRGTTDWRKTVEEKATNNRYNNILLAATNDNYMPYKDFHDEINVGTLNDGYVRKVPLPRAPRIQSTDHMTCNVTVTRDNVLTCYLEQVPRIPSWRNLSRSLVGISRTTILPLLPVWLM